MILETLKGQMDKLEELLPGIENYLTETLANENLSAEAEELRQYYVERLDILKLPPTRPPRSSGSHIKDECLKQKMAPVHDDLDSADGENGEKEVEVIPNSPVVDFAAKQRELSRTLLTKSGDESDDEWSSLCRKANLFLPFLKDEGKVYDDIGEDGSETGDKDDQDLYEIPVTSASSDNLGPTSSLFEFPPDSSEDLHSATTTLTDHSQSRPSLPLIDTNNVTTPPPPAGAPPPLPPRHHRQSSDEHSSASLRLSLTIDEPPELPARPNLPPRSEIYALSERSDKSEKSEKSEDPTDEASDACVNKPVPHETGTSYESYEEEAGATSQDSDLLSKLNLKLPVPIPRKKKKRKAFSKSQSSSQWDLNLSFKDLEEVSICGELNLHGKLTWNRRIVAVTNRRLLCYKPEKMSKPALVVQLSGYQSTYNERENKKGFEILLHHPLVENYVFSVDLLEWAQSWCEYIQAACEGREPPGRVLRLYRHSGSYLTDLMYRNKVEVRSASSTSIASSDAGSEHGSSGRRENRERSSRMVSLAQRASTFLGKKRAKKLTVIGIPAEVLSEARPRPAKSADCYSTSEGRYKTLPTSQSTDKGTSYQKDSTVSQEGYLHVYSTYNRKRIGKRWCVVRENQFECYPGEHSEVCEMTFPLKDCTFRQAKEETKSEKGIMILLNGAEKITVEPLKFEAMDDWVSMLLRETMTVKVPEGLDKYYTEKEYEVPPEDLLDRTDPDDPYSCIKDISVNNSLEEAPEKSTATAETKDTSGEEKPKDAKAVADMYSPVLWETKRRNSSRSSVSSERETSSPSAVIVDKDKQQTCISEESCHGSLSYNSTPESQPMKSLYTAAVTDSGYTTASSPTSANQESPNDNENNQLSNKVLSPSKPNTMESLLKSWDVKARIQNLEKTKPNTNLPKLAVNLKFPKQTTVEAGVKSKVFSYEQNKSQPSTPTPTPPKRKRSLSAKNKQALQKGLSNSNITKPVSLPLTSSETVSSDSTETLKPSNAEQHEDPANHDASVYQGNIAPIDTSEAHTKDDVKLPIRDESVTSCDTDSWITSSFDTDSCVTDSSESALRSEHETPTNSDTESLNCLQSPEYKNLPSEMGTKELVFTSTDERPSLGEDSRESSQERFRSRESSQEPTTSCSSWDSSQETNCYNFGNESATSSDTDAVEENDEIFTSENQKSAVISVDKKIPLLSVSSENSLNSDVTLISNKTLSTDSVHEGNHSDSTITVHDQDLDGDISHWLDQLDTLRRKLVDLKTNRIKMRDRRLRARDEKEWDFCEEEFQKLDEACKETDQEISMLEGRIKLAEGNELTLSSEA